VVYDKKNPRKIKRESLSYGSEFGFDVWSHYWQIKKTQVQKLMVVEIGMIWWICGFMRLDMIRNEVIWEKVGGAPMKDKMRESRLR